jgi:RNA polymerase sigma-70 factor (sigma-E family)
VLDSDGAHDSFTAWVASRRDRLLRSTYLLTGDVGRAEDLVQDALVKVARRWSRLRDTNPDAYIRKVIYHDHVSWWRSRREVPVAEVLATSPENGGAQDQGILIEQALARLTAKQRAVIVLRYVDDVTEVEAAAALGVSVGTVKSQTSAALRRLREQAPELLELRGDGDTR